MFFAPTARAVAPPAAQRSARRRVGALVAIPVVAGFVLSTLAAPAHAADDFDVVIRADGNGTFTGQGNYSPGQSVTLTATPADNQVWDGWTSQQLGWIGARAMTFTMPASDVVLDTTFRAPAAPLKDVYANDFKVGNIWSGPQSFADGSPNSAVLARNFNILTAENAMKPEQLLPNNNIDPTTGAFTFNFATADQFVQQATARGSQVHGHVLVWHAQSPARLNTGATGSTRALAKENMRRYIEAVLTHFSGQVPTWDVVNEAFVDGLSSFDPATQDWRDFLRGGPNGGNSAWYAAYARGANASAGETPSDFIYDAFVYAREYGPEVNLQYNDFNVFQSAGKARAIIAMVTDLNARYNAEHPGNTRPLIEAVGMQSHNYINQTQAFACTNSQMGDLVNTQAASWQSGACSDTSSVETSIQELADAGIKVAISELDLMVWEAWNAEPEGSSAANYHDLSDPVASARISKPGFTFWTDKIQNRAELQELQAQRFAEYFAVYRKYSQNISRVTFWGLTDRLSWRANHNPLLLNGDFSEKLAMLAVSDPDAWFARSGAGGAGIPVEATVPEAAPGNLTLTVADYGSGVVLSKVDNAGDRLRFEGDLPAVTVTDSRNPAQAGDGGWAVTGRSRDFASGGHIVTADHLGWKPSIASPRAGLTPGDVVQTKLGGGAGLADPRSLATANAQGRFGSAVLGAGLRLELPVDANPGTYEGRLTVSLFPVD